MGKGSQARAGSDGPDGDEKEEREGPITARAGFEPSELARRIESAHRMSTQPPEPECEVLRESCKAIRVAEVDLKGGASEGALTEDRRTAPTSTPLEDAIHAVLQGLGALPHSAKTREMRARAESYSRAIEEWKWATIPPSNARRAALRDLVLALHAQFLDTQKESPRRPTA